jgi:hypothetical protein
MKDIINSVVNLDNTKKQQIRKNKESDLALIVVEHLDELDYDVYKEVSKAGGGSDRADIYAVKKTTSTVIDNNNEDKLIGATVSIETKLNFNIKVLEQAYNWKNWANLNYIAIPVIKKTKIKNFCYHLCESIGVGIIEVDIDKKICFISVNPTPNLEIKPPKLFEEQKLSIAGNDKNQFVTPFKITCTRIQKYMEDKVHIKMSDLVKNINHHYSSNISAASSLSKYIELGIIENITIKKTKSGLYVINLLLI